MKFIIISLVLISFAFASNDFEYADADHQFVEAAPEETLLAVAKHLHTISPSHLSYDAHRIAKHAALLQNADSKAKAYAHNFKRSTAAINAALSALTSQLNTGHKHDKNALKTGKSRADAAIKAAEKAGVSKTSGYKAKSCPAKRDEEDANEKKNKAKKKTTDVGNKNICTLSTTYGDMDVDKPVPTFGTALRRAWDKVRARYLKNKRISDAATKAYNTALQKRVKAMASFKASLKIEVANAHNACKTAHKDYEALKKEVASNVAMRKSVWIATLVVKCYVDNITSNANAKKCADKKRKSSTSRWNITPGSLARCKSTATLRNNLGPSGWRPTPGNCGQHKGTPTEVKNKERKSKELKSKEAAAKRKERADKKKEKADKAAKKREQAAKQEKRAKAQERKSKELGTKEKKTKERTSKAEKRAKESANKERSNKRKERTEKHLRERTSKARERTSKEQTSKERKNKEKSTKEKNNKEKNTKERTKKAAAERKSKELKSKESKAKKKERADKAKKKEHKAKAQERKSKELKKKEERTGKERNTKEAKNKERTNKERSNKERTNKERTNKERSRKATKEKEGKNERGAKQRARAEKANKVKRKQQKERAQKQATERRTKNTCVVRAYKDSHYRGGVVRTSTVCSRYPQTIKYAASGRRRGYVQSSFTLSSGCKKVEIFDEDKCKAGYYQNMVVTRSTPTVTWDLNDDICGIKVWSKC